MAKETNWDKLSKRSVADNPKYRDVYEDQQLERSKIQEKQSPLSRIILALILSLMIGVGAYIVASMLMFGVSYVKDSVSSAVTGVAGSTATHSTMPRGTVNNGLMPAQKPVDKKSDGPDLKVIFKPNKYNVGFGLFGTLLTFGISYPLLMKNLQAQNVMSETSDINQYQNDQHIQVPEEVMTNFDIFPDAGAHSNVVFSSQISHAMLKAKGLKSVPVTQRYQKDTVDKDGTTHYKGEPLIDSAGNVVTKTLPIIDEAFGDELFEASGIKDKALRVTYDATKIAYNKGNENRDKLIDKEKPYNTVADVINRDWFIPEYEFQRPSGIYVVDTAPVNTMV